jgi:hypothetical protein
MTEQEVRPECKSGDTLVHFLWDFHGEHAASPSLSQVRINASIQPEKLLLHPFARRRMAR